MWALRLALALLLIMNRWAAIAMHRLIASLLLISGLGRIWNHAMLIPILGSHIWTQISGQTKQGALREVWVSSILVHSIRISRSNTLPVMKKWSHNRRHLSAPTGSRKAAGKLKLPQPWEYYPHTPR